MIIPSIPLYFVRWLGQNIAMLQIEILAYSKMVLLHEISEVHVLSGGQESY